MFAFIAPLWLFAIPLAAGLLLFAYLRHGRNKQRKVSSLFFIKQVAPSIARGRSKLSLPWRILFELLVLIALIAALSGMLLRNTSEQASIIIDNSLSMGALLNPGGNQETLLDEAKRAAISNLELFSEISRAAIWVTSPTPQQLTDGFVSTSQARSRISDISLSFASGNISSLLSRIKDESGRILVFTDQAVLPADQAANPAIRLEPLSSNSPRRENVAIESISLDRSVNGSDSQINVKVRSFLSSEVLCKISIDELGTNNKWNQLAARDISLSGLREKELSLKAGSDQFNGSQTALRAKITACSPEKSNALKLDDSAWVSLSDNSSSMLLVSEFSAQQLGLDKIVGSRFEQIKPQDWNNINSRDLRDSGKLNLIIFHRFIPNQLPRSNALFIAPPEGSDLLKVNKLSGNSKLVRWESDNNLLRYLTLPNLELIDAVRFTEIPAWANPLMYSSSGPVALYGTLAAQRYAALGFEILPFEGRKNPFLSILTLNLVKWLSNSADSAETSYLSRISLPAKIRKAAFLDSTIENPNLKVAEDGESLTVDSPGIIETSGENSSALIAANFFSSSESNLAETGFVSLPQDKDEKKGARESGLTLELYLIIFALLILLIDSFLFLFRKQASARGQNAL